MKILFISNTGECLPIASRMRKEATDVVVYIHNPFYKKNYDGMGIQKVSLNKLKNTIKTVDIVIFDINKTNDNTKEDRALLKIFKCPLRSSTLFGPISDKIKRLYKNKKVIGCSTFTEELEMDRKKGSDLAKRLGFDIPETWEFDNLKEAIKFLKKNKDLWVFKCDNNLDLDLTYVEKFSGELIQKMSNEYMTRIGNKCEFILQKKVEGVEIDCEGWYTGTGWTQFNYTFENKNFLAGNLGVHIGSQSNTVFIANKESEIIQKLKGMDKHLKKAGYIGPCDITTIIDNKGKIYFLEWGSIRFGYDALYCLLTLLKGKLTDFFVNDFKADFHKEFSCAQRISIPPFPYNIKSLLRDMAKDVLIEGYDNSFWMEDIYFKDGVRCAGSDGIIGVMTNKNKTLEKAWQGVYHKINKLQIGSYIQYRIDGFKQVKSRIEQLEKKGII